MFAMALGEQLESLGAPIVAIGAYGTAEDFLDGVYQYPGGWLGDRLGRRRALVLVATLPGPAVLTGLSGLCGTTPT